MTIVKETTAHDHDSDPNQSGPNNFNMESNGLMRNSCWLVRPIFQVLVDPALNKWSF